MATYSELYSVTSDTALLERVAVAAAIAAQGIADESADTPYHDRRKLWASRALQAPTEVAQQLLWALIAQNKDAELTTITGATDAQIQSAVTNVLDVLVER